MSEPLPVTVENAIQIAWDFLERSGEITDPKEASRFLLRTVAELTRQGERRRLMLANRAIDAYRKHKQSSAA